MTCTILYALETFLMSFPSTYMAVQHSIGRIWDESKNGNDMRDDTKFNGGIRDKNLCRERDLRISTGGMRDSSKIDGGMRDQNIKSQVTDITRRTTAITRRDQDHHSDRGGIAGLNQKDLQCTTQNPLLEHLTFAPSFLRVKFCPIIKLLTNDLQTTLNSKV